MMKEYDQKWLDLLDSIIEQNLSNSDFVLPDLYQAMSSSHVQLYRRVRKLTGLAPKQYIRKKRLEHAKVLLERGVYPTVAEIALAVGYNHPNFFSTLYEKEFGRRPISYLK